MPWDRAKVFAGGKARRESRRRRDIDDGNDEGLLAAASEIETRLAREARWEHFMFREQQDKRVHNVMKRILGSGAVSLLMNTQYTAY